MRPGPTQRSLPGIDRHGFWWLVGNVGFASWFIVTVASQHPNRVFDRFRRYDRSGLLIPNWRFFAPEPARHDFQVLHRVLTAGGEATPWKESIQFPPRTWIQAVWFPTRRQDKAVFDVCHDLLALMQNGTDVRQSPAYRLLQDFVDRRVQEDFADGELPQGFQFIVVRHAGHDDEPDPDYILVSQFVPLIERESPQMAASGLPRNAQRPQKERV